jgi:hypothetical protein
MTTKEDMNSIKKGTIILEEVKVNIRVKLSALWITLMLFYIYADILGFYTPGNIESVVSGEIGGVQITEGFLFMMAIWMAIPSVMVFLSLTLRANVNRWVNILVAIFSIFALAATFFAGEISARYAFQAILEGLLMVAIIWSAWKWPKLEA